MSVIGGEGVLAITIQRFAFLGSVLRFGNIRVQSLVVGIVGFWVCCVPVWRREGTRCVSARVPVCEKWGCSTSYVRQHACVRVRQAGNSRMPSE